MTSAADGRRIVDIRFTEKKVAIVLADGRMLAAPLSWVGKVAEFDEAARREWVTVDDGHGVNWPAAGQTSDTGALDVWMLEQDALFEAALAVLAEAGWDATVLDPRTRELVALWRLEADVYNGGFLQFLGNWGVPEVALAMASLDAVGAAESHRLITRAWSILEPIAARDDVSSIDDVFRALTDDDRETLDEIDEAYWENPDGLPRLTALHYGPAASATFE